jgi:hypothetical protein
MLFCLYGTKVETSEEMVYGVNLSTLEATISSLAIGSSTIPRGSRSNPKQRGPKDNIYGRDIVRLAMLTLTRYLLR